MSILDKKIGRLFYKVLVKNDTRAFLKAGFSEAGLDKIIYNRREDAWKESGILLEDISKVVADVCKVRPLHGIKLWVTLRKANTTIRERIKQGFLVFISDNIVSYKGRGNYSHRKMTYDELAQEFIDVTRQGLQKEQIVGILNKEYRRSKKVNAVQSAGH